MCVYYEIETTERERKSQRRGLCECVYGRERIDREGKRERKRERESERDGVRQFQVDAITSNPTLFCMVNTHPVEIAVCDRP